MFGLFERACSLKVVNLGFVLTAPSGAGPGHCILTSKIVTNSELLFPVLAPLQGAPGALSFPRSGI